MPERYRGRVRVGIVVCIALSVVLGWAVMELAAFDPSIHESITEDVLEEKGFDDDAADEVGDSNYWTDTFEQTTDAAHADNNQLAAASTRLRSKRTLIGDSLNSCQRRKALDALGEALHTVQDIYSHSNSVDNEIEIPNLLSMADGTATCAPPGFAPDGLVTGYFNLYGPAPFLQCRGIGPGQCCHRDLNKDNEDVPNGGNHKLAKTAAKQATGTYLDLVEEDIRARFPAADATQFLKMLKQTQRTQIFVIDDTGSMGDDIAGVQAAANRYLDSLIAGSEAPTLGLVTFKDTVQDRGLQCSVETLRSQINALTASGGGDCPEASNAALLAALDEIPLVTSDVQLRGGRILLATDASAGDSHLGPLVAAGAAVRGVSIDAILTGDCFAEEVAGAPGPSTVSSNDPRAGKVALPPLGEAATDPLSSPSARTQLRALADATGGVLFNVTRLEVDDVVPTLLELGDPDNTLLTRRRVELTAGTPVDIEVPVDDGLAGKVTFMVTASRAGILPDVGVTRPNGQPVQPTDSDVTLRSLSSVVSYALRDPAAGVWRVRLAGEGTFVFRAFGGAPFRLSSLRLQKAAEGPHRPEAELVPVDGQPVAGASIFGDLRFTAEPRNLRVVLRRPDGSLLAELAPVRLEDGRHFRAPLTVPGETFVVEATGLTPGGVPFVRQITVPVNPQVVGLSLAQSDVEAAPGTTATVEVTVLNAASSAATFQLSASGSLGWPVSAPPAFPLAAGASATLHVEVAVPVGTPAGARNDLTLLVENVAAPQVRNSAVAGVVVAATQVDLRVTQTESRDPVVAGSGPGNLTYVVTVANAGPFDATGVRLRETLNLPPGVTVDSVVPSGATVFADPVWTVGNLPLGGQATLTVHLTVGASAAPGATVSSTAAVLSANQPLVNSGDDTFTESTAILGAPAAEVPTVSTWGLLALGLALGASAVYRLRRRAREQRI